MSATIPGILLPPDTHANRPAAASVESGTIFPCTDHNTLDQSDGATWSTWGTFGAATAADLPITDTGGYFTGTDVEAALQELGAETAADVPIADAGNYFSGTDVEAALQELGAASGGAGSPEQQAAAKTYGYLTWT